ncbi:hypothetical protein N7466_006183 [Penicillium verhagenii]|uniref:uncharacterized protein n=1 Tax=Penicillium verhagenii TaxID=1562060 RepID=UPI00254549D4|nr:uncharacterized protein N7466_006183 [Penicillium verhagenii]KAJ5930690.1 hypothetical protein N7466_006183 [Penicillium verhagenii]
MQLPPRPRLKPPRIQIKRHNLTLNNKHDLHPARRKLRHLPRHRLKRIIPRPSRRREARILRLGFPRPREQQRLHHDLEQLRRHAVMQRGMVHWGAGPEQDSDGDREGDDAVAEGAVREVVGEGGPAWD